MKTWKLASLAVAVLVAGACHTPTSTDDHWGEAVRINRDAMIENPVPVAKPSEGLDARSAEHVLENYSKGQEAQEHRRDRSLTEEVR